MNPDELLACLAVIKENIKGGHIEMAYSNVLKLEHCARHYNDLPLIEVEEIPLPASLMKQAE